MKAVKVNEYSKLNKNGKMQTNYVYKVTGTEQELADFQGTLSAKSIAKEDGDNGVKAGDHLWFTSSFEGESIDNLVITKANRVAVDRSEERKVLSIASRMGKAGDSIIQNYVDKQLRKATVETSVAKVTVPAGDIDNLNLD